MQLDGNTVLITGGASGIGRALAVALLERGNEIIVCGRDSAKLAALKAQEPGIVTYRCDLANDSDQRELVHRLRDRYPRLNVLINNAGIQHNYHFTDGEELIECIGEEIGINLAAPVKLTARLLPQLLEQKRSAIVNVTSALALTPKRSAAVYCATKAAMRGFTQALRYQLEQTAVTVFEIIPALVDTAMTAGRGSGKITPEALAREVLCALEADRYEIRIAKTKLLFALYRLYPALAARLVRNG